MSNINDKATVSLFVNGEQAEQAMERLSSKADDLRKSMQAALDSGDKKAANKLQRELDKVTKELNRTESAAKGTGIVLEKLSNSSIHGLRNALKYLEKQLRMTKPDSTEWKKYAGQIDAVKTRIKELQSQIEGSGSIWSKFKNWAEDTWPAIDLLSRGYDSAINFMRSNVDAYASMDQEMANVRKFTGMTEDEVKALNEEFKKIDTRTSREELNKLAQEAGRLGKTSHEDVLGFVRAADQINVALDDLGDDATLKLSKLTGIFGDEAKYGTEKSLLKVGSVINELSQNCSASAPYLAQFTERMGGVGSQARMTIPQIMGLAAVLDTNAQAVEASSTAVSQVLVRMMQDPAKYAKVAGLEVNKFATMLKEDANGALIMFLEALQKAGGMDVLSPMFKDMGENGSRAISALSTLATHIDQVKAQQEAANIAFEEGTSISKEFAVQNNTVQAALDKAKNSFQELRVELGEYLYPVMGHLLTSTSALMRAILSSIVFVKEHKAAVMSLVAAIAGYTVMAKSALIVDKSINAIAAISISLSNAKSRATANLTVVTEGLRLAYFKLTGQTQKAAVAQKAFTTAMAATPWGAIFTAIASAIVAYKMFDDKINDTTESYNALDKVYEKASATLKDEESQLKHNIKTIQDFNGSKDEEKRLINELNSKYGPILGTYSSLSEWLKTLTTRGNEYCQSLHDQIVMEGKLEEARVLISKAVELRTSGDGTAKDIGTSIAELLSRNIGELWDGNAGVLYTPYTVRDLNNEKLEAYWSRMFAKAEEYEKRAETLREEAYEMAEKLRPLAPQVEISEDTITPPGTNTPSSNQKDRFAKEKAWRERQEAEARISYAIGETDYIAYTKRMDEIAVEFYEKQLLHTDLSEAERLKIAAEWHESQKKQQETFTAESVAEEDNRYNMELAKLKQMYLDSQISKETYDQRLEEQEILHQQKLISLYDKQVDKRIEAENNAYSESLRILEDYHINKLISDEEYNKQLQDLENQHNSIIKNIHADGAQQRYQTEDRLQKLLMAQMQRRQQEYEKLEAQYASMKKDYFGDNPQEAQAKYDKDLMMLDVVYQRELMAAGNNADEKLRIDEAYEVAKLALKKKYGLLSEEDTRNAMERGVSASVEWLNSDGGKALTGSLNTLTSGMSAIFSGLSSIVQAELEIQTAKIEKRYGREIQLAQGNSYMVAQLEKKKAAELAKEKNKANKKMFAMQVIQAVAQTAQNAISAYGSAAAIPIVGLTLAPIAAAMAVAAGAIQIAAIKKQQQASEAQGYSKGGFTKPGAVDEPAGIVHAGEWVASQKLLANPIARPMIEALDLAQRTNTIGSLKPEDVSRSITANNSLARIAESDSGSALMVAAAMKMAQTADSLTERLNEPFVTINTVTGPHGINQAQDDYERLMKNVTPKSKFK